MFRDCTAARIKIMKNYCKNAEKLGLTRDPTRPDPLMDPTGVQLATSLC